MTAVHETGLGGRHALVTGGGRGIGRAVAAALSGAGADVTVLGRDAAALAATVEAGAAARHVIADVTDAAAISAAVNAAVAAGGRIDILIANAGGAESGPFLAADDAQFQRMFALNVMGTVHTARAVLGDMVARGFGRIVAVASTAGLKGYPYVTAYCAAKHAVIGLTRALAQETAASGVTVNAVCPGFTDTDLVRRSTELIAAKTGRSPADALGTILRDKPLGRLIAPQEVAAAVLFLCTPQASGITGTTLAIAGGEV